MRPDSADARATCTCFGNGVRSCVLIGRGEHGAPEVAARLRCWDGSSPRTVLSGSDTTRPSCWVRAHSGVGCDVLSVTPETQGTELWTDRENTSFSPSWSRGLAWGQTQVQTPFLGITNPAMILGTLTSPLNLRVPQEDETSGRRRNSREGSHGAERRASKQTGSTS